LNEVRGAVSETQHLLTSDGNRKSPMSANARQQA